MQPKCSQKSVKNQSKISQKNCIWKAKLGQKWPRIGPNWLKTDFFYRCLESTQNIFPANISKAILSGQNFPNSSKLKNVIFAEHFVWLSIFFPTGEALEEEDFEEEEDEDEEGEEGEEEEDDPDFDPSKAKQNAQECKQQ